jgi:hypothetical protein
LESWSFHGRTDLRRFADCCVARNDYSTNGTCSVSLACGFLSYFGRASLGVPLDTMSTVSNTPLVEGVEGAGSPKLVALATYLKCLPVL